MNIYSRFILENVNIDIHCLMLMAVGHMSTFSLIIVLFFNLISLEIELHVADTFAMPAIRFSFFLYLSLCLFIYLFIFGILFSL